MPKKSEDRLIEAGAELVESLAKLVDAAAQGVQVLTAVGGVIGQEITRQGGATITIALLVPGAQVEPTGPPKPRSGQKERA